MFNFLQNNEKYFILLLCSIVATYILALPIDIMDIDAAQYAQMGREMLETGNFLEVTNRLIPYLDKPPLIFWLVSLSFKVFGYHNFAFKLPSLIFALIAIIYTYKLAKLFLSLAEAQYAALILASCQAMFLITNDCRTDTILLGGLCMGIYYLSKFHIQNSYKNIILAAVGISLALLSKGPIGLVVPVMAFGTWYIFKNKWKHLLDFKWLLFIAVIALMLLPMCIGLYNQWGTYGLRFYFWTQSFGRITGESVWKNDLGPFFFIHTMAWSFIPWTVFFILALAAAVLSILKKQASDIIYLCVGGFLLPFIALSSSNYKLPHYIYVCLPFAAILTAMYFGSFKLVYAKIYKLLTNIHLIINILLIVFVLALCFWAFYDTYLWFWALAAVLGVIGVCIFWRKNEIVHSCIVAAISANVLLSGWFYPQLLKLQTPTTVGRIVGAQATKEEPLLNYRLYSYFSEEYHSGKVITVVSSTQEIKDKTQRANSFWIYTDSVGKAQIDSMYANNKVMHNNGMCGVSMLRREVLDPKLRPKEFGNYYLIYVKK